MLNGSSFIENIGDKGVRTLRDAENYIITVPQASYEKYGFGLWMMELRDTNAPVGMCGLIKRDYLDDVDVGYAILTEHCSKGYATEAVEGVVKYAIDNMSLKRFAAIVNPDNTKSIKVLEKTGFVYESPIQIPGEEIEIQLYIYMTV